jgi:serine/threonine protein kinase
MPSTVKGTPQFMAPELLGFATHSTSHNSKSTNQCAADMWSLGEIVFQMLTKKPAFPQLSQLILYIQGLQRFPNSLLTQHGVSSCGQDFILSVMLLSPDSRLKALQAWNHEWMEKYKSSYLSSCLTTPARYQTLSRVCASCI